MAKIGKIKSIPKNYDTNPFQTMEGSLSRLGYNRFPTTAFRIVPYKEKNNTYRTGLDENALYIKRLEKINPEDAELEKARVRGIRKELEDITGLDLGPKSDYYAKMFDEHFGTDIRARIVKLQDGDNLFNLEDPYERITYEWLKVHEFIAPSLQAYREGKVQNSKMIQFYVDDEDYEVEATYKKNMLFNKASAEIDKMSFEKMYKVATLLGLKPNPTDKQEVLYNAINHFIKNPKKNASPLENVHIFNKIIEMSPENLDIRVMVAEALKYNIYRIKDGGYLYEGSEVIAKSRDALAHLLAEDQEFYLVLKEKVRQRKEQDIIF